MFSHFEVSCDSVQFQRNNYWVGGIKLVLYLYGMHGLSGNGCHKLWNVIDLHFIHVTLHWVEKVSIKALN